MFGSEYIQFKKTEAYLTPKGWYKIGYQHKSVVVNISLRRESWADIVKEGRGEKALYLLASLPDDKQALVAEKILAPHSLEEYRLLYRAEQQAALVKSEQREIKGLFNTWVENYKEYLDLYPSPQHNAVQAKGLAVYCSIVMGIIEQVKDVKINLNKSLDLKPICALAKERNLPYVAKNWRTLQAKVTGVMFDGKRLEELIYLPRAGEHRVHRGKFKGDEELMSWLLDLRSRTANNPNVYVQRRIEQVCTLIGRKCPSKSWMAQKMANEEFKRKAFSMLPSATRHGLKYRLYTPFAGALHSGDCWQMDGTRVNFSSFKLGKHKRKFLYIVAVRDVYSGDILGVSFALQEDSKMYKEALAMAVNTSGYFPYEVVFDRFPGHTSEDWKALEESIEYRGLSKFRYTEKAEGKPQWERWWATLQSVFMEDSPFYYGEGIQASRKHSRKHDKYLKEVNKRLENKEFNDVWREAWRVISNYRHTKLHEWSRKHKKVMYSPEELHRLSERPATKEVNKVDEAWLFWNKTTLQIRGNALKKEYRGVEYIYKLWNWEKWKQESDVVLAWNENDMSKAYVFKTNGELIEEVQQFKRPNVMGPDADWKEAGKAIAQLKSLQEQILSEAQAEVAKGRKPLDYVDEETGELKTLSIEEVTGGMWDKYRKEDAETEYLLATERQAMQHVARQAGILKEQNKKHDGWRSDKVSEEQLVPIENNKEQNEAHIRSKKELKSWVQKQQWGF